MPCLICGIEETRIVRIRNGRADYFCNDCMNDERDSFGGVEGSDEWLVVPVESTLPPLE